MARSSSEDAEILVHITAPCRAADDVVYRQLARAYLAFQPQTRTALPRAEPPIDAQAHVAQPEQQTRAQTAPPSGQDMATTLFGQSFEIGSQDLSFEGALNNFSSPRIRYATTAVEGIASSSQETDAGSLRSWCEPPSQISDSYPMPDAGLLNVSPTRVLQRYIGTTSPPQASPTSMSPTARKRRQPTSDSGRIDVPSSLPVPSQEESLSLLEPGYVDIVDVIGTPRVKKTIEGPGALKDTESAATEIFDPDITHISNSVVSSRSPIPSPRAGSEPPSAKRSRVGHVQHADLVRSSSDTGPSLSARNSQAAQLSTSLEIRPPSPPVGVEDVDPTDLISEKFAKLARDLSSRYRPSPKRPMIPFERGYWLLDCTSWSPEIRFNTWVFLSNYLNNGLAGWGTWCRRDKTHDWIRLYSWGHVAKHTYLLLYLASERQLKTTGASWYGADGEVVLEVPPYERQA
ncbi:hypothetical protein FALBO_10440 [Fusarium albosuccineum]|uniref:Uncharacterized protein n=1 Tax=Fusarium albosuccineum TaxID=1237068 RepID=A0A8H4L6Z0_9HYPO|nr:hypothetical protein FALBO_10440 [Fusarium albosuccineum]